MKCPSLGSFCVSYLLLHNELSKTENFQITIHWLSRSFWGQESRSVEPLVLAQRLSWGDSPAISWGCSYLKVQIGLGDPLFRWFMHVGAGRRPALLSLPPRPLQSRAGVPGTLSGLPQREWLREREGEAFHYWLQDFWQEAPLRSFPCLGNSLAIQWFDLQTSTAEAPGQGTKIPQAMWHTPYPAKRKSFPGFDAGSHFSDEKCLCHMYQIFMGLFCFSAFLLTE